MEAHSLLEFPEPQSMNFEILLNDVYLQFLEQTKLVTGMPNSVITYGNKLHQYGVMLFNEKGHKLETLDEQFDDAMVFYTKH